MVARAIRILTQNWGNHAFSEIIKQPLFQKKLPIQNNVWNFFSKLKLNAWIPLIFYSDSSNSCQDLLFPPSYKLHKNICFSRHRCYKTQVSRTIQRYTEQLDSDQRIDTVIKITSFQTLLTAVVSFVFSS